MAVSYEVVLDVRDVQDELRAAEEDPVVDGRLSRAERDASLLARLLRGGRRD